MAAPDETELDVRRYLRGLWRRRLLVLLVVLLAVNATLLFSLRQDRVYRAEAKVLLTPQMFGDRTGLQLDAALAVQTEIQILESEPVRALVVQAVGPVGKVSAERVGQTLLISLKAEASNGRRAADVTNAYANAYVRFRGGLGDGAVAAADVPQSAGAGTTSTAQLVSLASVPGSPVAPKPVRDSILAGVMGLIIALGLATALEALDDSVKTRAELRKATDLPVLGVIPLSPGWDGPLTLDQVPPAAAEAFRALRTSVQLLGVDRPVRNVHVTSAGSGEGKTTIVANLAMVLAQTGQRVAMIDADLRRPRLHDVFGLPNRVGVTSVLAGQSSVLGALQTAAGTSNLMLLASGPLPPNPSELLASKKMSQLIFALGDHFDVVIIDSPPVLAVTDAILLTTWAEATVVVSASGGTKRKQLATTLELLRQAEAPVVGAILNRATAEEDVGSKYQSYYQRAGQVAVDRSAAAATGGRTEGNGVSEALPLAQGVDRDGHRVGEEKDQR